MASDNDQVIQNEVGQPNDAGVVDAAPSTRRFDPSFKRNVMIIGGMFAVSALAIAALLMFRASGTKQINTAAVDVGRSGGSIQSDGAMSPAMRDALKAKQEAEKRQAEQSGQGVYIPPETLNVPQAVKPAPARPVEPPPATTGQVPVAAPLDQSALEAARQRDAMRRAGLERQIGALLTANATGAMPARVTFAAATGQGSQPTQLAQATAQSSSAVAARTVAQPAQGAATGAAGGANGVAPLVEGLEIVAAETASPIDTYRTKYASARIVSGKLKGAFLTGSVSQTEDGLLVSYNMMRHAGKTYQVDAVGLDEKTSTDALDASVDRRYLQRFVIPVVMATAAGYAQARAQTGSTIVDIGGGVTTGTTGSAQTSVAGISTPAPTVEQARNAGINAGLGILQQEVAKAAAKPFQMTLPDGTPIGILFRTPVMAR